jgi:hypothetical protein
VSATVAACATPALWHTPAYYAGVAGNEAARRGVGLWQPLGLGFFDVLLILSVLGLAVIAFRGRSARTWEAVACLGLAAATVHSARLGTWLAVVLAYPASRGWRERSTKLWFYAVPSLTALCIVGLGVGIPDSGSQDLAHRAARTNAPVLAEPAVAEQVALAGGRLWVVDPLDAFRAADQRLYLDWLEGHGDDAVSHVRFVIVEKTSRAGKAADRDGRLERVAVDRNFVLYRRR